MIVLVRLLVCVPLLVVKWRNSSLNLYLNALKTVQIGELIIYLTFLLVFTFVMMQFKERCGNLDILLYVYFFFSYIVVAFGLITLLMMTKPTNII